MRFKVNYIFIRERTIYIYIYRERERERERETERETYIHRNGPSEGAHDIQQRHLPERRRELLQLVKASLA